MTDQNYYPAEQYHSLAIVSLIFGILGLTQLLPVVGPIGAIIAGKMAQKEIRDRPDLYKGDNLARAGVLTGWIGIGLFALGLVLVILGLLFFLPVRTILTPR